MSRFLRLYMTMAIGLAVLAPFSPTAAQAGPGVSGYAEEGCYVSGLMSKMRCYSLVRPRYEGSAENITLKGVIIPSDAVVPEPDPLVILAGGPGQAASDMVATFTRLFRPVNSTRDLIFFDIRGAGLSAPVACDGDDDDLPPLTHIAPEKIVSELEKCRRTHGETLKGATTRAAVADLDALRQALGIEQLNLWGGSYGTRLAQYYIVAHEDHVRSAILDAVVPFSPSYLTLQAGHGLAALNKVKADCAADEACARAFPDFDATALLDRIEDGREISYRHPVTGQPVTTKTSRPVVAQTVFTALYSPASRIFIPFALTEAVVHDNWGPMAVMSVDTARLMGMRTIYTGPFLSITCADEAAALRAPRASPNPFFRDGGNMELMQKLCRLWSVDAEALPRPKEASIAVPTFMISGGYDPITPPDMARQAMKAFRNARHFIVRNGGHINSTVPCVAAFLVDFIKTPEDQDLRPECIGDGHVPAFVTGLTDPAPAGEAK